jgi:hypothetical protein
MKYLITFMIILGMFICGSALANDKVQLNFENTTNVTKIMYLNLMDQPCYIDRFGRIKCYHSMMVAEMRPEDDTVKTNYKVGKNVGDRFCVKWNNQSSNQEKFNSEFCFIIKEDTFEVNMTPEGIEVVIATKL